MTVLQNSSAATSPRVSVLMTIYNAAPYLRAAIDSLIEQTFADWELIAVENGSTDSSFEILKSYSDSRIKIYSFEKNIGRTLALRYAHDHSSGELVAVLDADDVAYPLRFSRQVAFLDNNSKFTLVASWARYIDKFGNVIGTFTPPVVSSELKDSLGWGNPIAHSSVMYRNHIAREAGGYPAAFVWAQDSALFLAMASSYPLAVLDEFLCQIRIQDTNMTSSSAYRLIVATEKLQLLELAGKSISFTQRGKRLNRGARAFAEIRVGVAYIYSRNFLGGLGRIAHALKKDIRCLLIFLAFKASVGRISIK